MPTPQQRKVVFTLYRNIFRFCKALDRNGPNAVQMQMSKLNAHLYIPTVYTSLAQSAIRAFPKKVIQESENACSAASSLFRMPLPPNEYEAKQEMNYRMDMAFAAIKFMNDQYQHVVEQKSDVIDSQHWTEILKDKDRIEDGAIAIARIADSSLQADVVHAELDRIAHLVQNELAIDTKDTVDTPSTNKEKTSKEAAERDSLDVSNSEGESASTLFLRVQNELAVDMPSTTKENTGSERDTQDVSKSEGDMASSQWTLKVLEKLNKVFFGDLGFKGNRADYYDPRNSIIHDVLSSRTGNPITLSVAYMAVSRRLGVPLYGAECPCHFVVRGYHANGETFFVDVFNSGAIMTLQGVKDLYLSKNQAAPMRIYARMMRNLVNAHMIIGKGDKALLWTERIRVLENAASAVEGRREGVASGGLGWRGAR